MGSPADNLDLKNNKMFNVYEQKWEQLYECNEHVVELWESDWAEWWCPVCEFGRSVWESEDEN